MIRVTEGIICRAYKISRTRSGRKSNEAATRTRSASRGRCAAISKAVSLAEPPLQQVRQVLPAWTRAQPPTPRAPLRGRNGPATARASPTPYTSARAVQTTRPTVTASSANGTGAQAGWSLTSSPPSEEARPPSKSAVTFSRLAASRSCGSSYRRSGKEMLEQRYLNLDCERRGSAVKVR